MLYIVKDETTQQTGLLKKQGGLAKSQQCCPYCPDNDDLYVQEYSWNGLDGNTQTETFGQTIKCYLYAQGYFNSIYRVYLYMSSVTITARIPSCNSVAFDVACQTGFYYRRIPDLSGGDEMIGPAVTYWEGVFSTPCDDLQGGEVELSAVYSCTPAPGANNGGISIECWNSGDPNCLNAGCGDTDWCGPPILSITFAP